MSSSPAHVPLPDPAPSSYNLTTQAGTDIWRKPPAHVAFNAPISYRELPLGKLKVAKVTVKAEWKTLYEQGGLILVWGDGKERKWVKTGIEFTHGKPHISTVACDRWADWSLLPLPGDSATVQMEREIVNGKPTSTLWIYAIEGAEKRPLREVTWVFEDVVDKESTNDETGKASEGKANCWVGIYTAKPKDNEDPDKKGEILKVDFEGFRIETF